MIYDDANFAVYLRLFFFGHLSSSAPAMAEWLMSYLLCFDQGNMIYSVPMLSYSENRLGRLSTSSI